MGSELNMTSPLVSAEWLHKNLDADNLIILDATMSKVTSSASDENNNQIPTARFFDIKNKFSDVSGAFPNTFPSSAQFQNEARLLGINNDSIVIVYDDKGIYSSPRAWWLFKAFGLQHVAVLDGGLPAWLDNGFDVVIKAESNDLQGNFEAKANKDLMCFFEDMNRYTLDDTCQVIDARSENRFLGIDLEPRKGLRSGHIPNSKNLFYKNVLQENGLMKSQGELKEIFKNNISHNNQTVFSCGSGITACILALGAEYVGYTNLCVYDGSWTEYGSLT